MATKKVTSPQASEMDQQAVQTLFREGGTLVLLGVPEGTEFGIDYNSWTVGNRFKGVKMIPPGVHFVYYSAANSDGQVAPRTGFFHNFTQREVLLKKWDKRLEDILPGEASAEEHERVKSNKEELDRFLGAYPYESYKKWVSLTSHISPELLEKLHPTSGKISAVTEFQSKMSTSQSRKEDALKKQATDMPSGGAPNRQGDGLPEMETVEGTEIRFTEFDRRKFPDGASAADITKYSMDTSFCLQGIIDTVYKEHPLDILGELQFAFICFLIGQVFDGFEQWKKLVALLCSCDESLVRHSDIFNQFINVMHYQVREIPEDFFVDIVSQNNFLTSTLQVFFSNLENNRDVEEPLKIRGRKFREHLERKFKWDFMLEPDDEAPVIVE